MNIYRGSLSIAWLYQTSYKTSHLRFWLDLVFAGAVPMFRREISRSLFRPWRFLRATEDSRARKRSFPKSQMKMVMNPRFHGWGKVRDLARLDCARRDRLPGGEDWGNGTAVTQVRDSSRQRKGWGESTRTGHVLQGSCRLICSDYPKKTERSWDDNTCNYRIEPDCFVWVPCL